MTCPTRITAGVSVCRMMSPQGALEITSELLVVAPNSGCPRYPALDLLQSFAYTLSNIRNKNQMA